MILYAACVPFTMTALPWTRHTGKVHAVADLVSENRLTREYDDLRRREFTVITDLLEVLPNIDGLDPVNAEQARDALFHADNPYLIVFVGSFSSGKSSLINALLGSGDILPVGPIPTTDRISIMRYGEQASRIVSGDIDTVMYPAPILNKVSLVDTPGLESVFQTHEAITRRFLHRADTVFYVMLATQAMTASSLQSLQTLRNYGKKVIILVNQSDLLSEDERTAVQNYVAEHSQAQLGLPVPVWMVSAKLGLAAQIEDDEVTWRASGLGQIEQYVDSQLDDAERLRQKLLTPLQIAETAAAHAVEKLKSNQGALDHARSISENVKQQLAAQERDQRQVIRDAVQQVEAQFAEIASRTGLAVSDIFQLNGVVGSVWRGALELVGIARLFRRGKTPEYVVSAFQKHEVFAPIAGLGAIVDKLGPQLEGRDLKDLDELASYAQREIKGLPAAIQDKVIGMPQPPVAYDRKPLQEVRPTLIRLEDEVRKLGSEDFARSARTAVVYLALWELLIVLFGLAIFTSGVLGDNGQAVFITLVLLLGLAMLGLLIMPLVGRAIAARLKTRIFAVQTEYAKALQKAAEEQLAYAMRLRHDVTAPLTRLVDAQAELHNQQLMRLHAIETELSRLEQDVNKLGRKGLFGLRG